MYIWHAADIDTRQTSIAYCIVQGMQQIPLLVDYFITMHRYVIRMCGLGLGPFRSLNFAPGLGLGL